MLGFGACGLTSHGLPASDCLKRSGVKNVSKQSKVVYRRKYSTSCNVMNRAKESVCPWSGGLETGWFT